MTAALARLSLPVEARSHLPELSTASYLKLCARWLESCEAFAEKYEATGVKVISMVV